MVCIGGSTTMSRSASCCSRCGVSASSWYQQSSSTVYRDLAHCYCGQRPAGTALPFRRSTSRKLERILAQMSGEEPWEAETGFQGLGLKTSCKAPLDSPQQIQSLEVYVQLFSSLLGSGRGAKRIAMRAGVPGCLCRAGSQMHEIGEIELWARIS